MRPSCAPSRWRLALTVLLNQAKFGDILRGLDDSRVSVVTLDTTRRLRQAVDLGLLLKDIAESRIHRRVSDRRIPGAAIRQHIRFAEGLLIVHGGQALNSGQENAPDVWLTGNREAHGEVWRLETPESFVVGGPIVNNFGKLEGGVAVRYGKARYTGIVGGLTDELLEAAIALFIASSVLAVLGTAAVLRRLIATARRLAASDRGPAGRRAGHDFG